MNAVETEEAVSELAEQSFDAGVLPCQFLDDPNCHLSGR